MSEPNERKSSQLEALPHLWTWLDSVVSQVGFQEFDAKDASASAKVKVMEILKDVQAGKRQRPRSMEAYLKQVCRNALFDWIRNRQARGARSPSSEERSLLDNVMYSSSTYEGDEERGGFHAVQAPSVRHSQRTPRSFLVGLIDRYQREHWDHPDRDLLAMEDACNDIRRNGPFVVRDAAEKGLRQLPDRTRQAARLYLMYWREAEIARQLGVSRAAVSNLLGRMRRAWGWNARQVEFERMRLLWANLYVVVNDALKPFRLEDDDPTTVSSSPEDFPSPPPDPPRFEGRQRFLGGPGSGIGSRVSEPDGWTVAWRRAREEAVVRALKASPALARCVRGIKREDVLMIEEFVDDMDWYDY